MAQSELGGWLPRPVFLFEIWMSMMRGSRDKGLGIMYLERAVFGYILCCMTFLATSVTVSLVLAGSSFPFAWSFGFSVPYAFDQL